MQHSNSHKHQHGATIVEMALVLVIFLALIGGMIDLLYYAYQEVRLQYLAVTASSPSSPVELSKSTKFKIFPF